MYLFGLSVLVVYHVGDVGHGRYHVHVEFAVEPFLHNLHVEQSQEPATEAETQGGRRLVLEGERGIVQLQLLQAGAQVFVVLGFDGINASEDHRLNLLESFYGLGRGVADAGDGVAHLHLDGILDARDDVAHIACAQLAARHHVHAQRSNLLCLILLLGVDEAHALSGTHHSVHYLEVGDDATIGVED